MPGDRKFVSHRTSFLLTWLLALLAALTLEIASGDGERAAGLIALIVAGEMAVVFVCHQVALRVERRVADDARSRLLWILVLATAPFIIEVLARGATNSMLPLELLLLAHFRNVVLALAVFAHRADCQRVCCSLATFLAIFASVLSTQVWLQASVVLFAAIGVWWLMGTYWESLRDRLAATSQQQLSRRWLVVLPAFALVLLGLPAAGMQTHVLRGFMLSSGGSNWYSEHARSGVGDGDALVAGTENVQSFAPIEDAPFRTSHEPSLYDLFDDSYNEPVKPRAPDRAIPLSVQLATKPREQHLATTHKAGKQFSTLRKFGEPKPSQVGDPDSNALLYVKGRVPLHLKLEVFDRYDGVDWFPEATLDAAHSPVLKMETLHGRPWLRLPVETSLELYGLPEVHALKIIRLDTNRVPAPTQLLGIHVDQLDRADFYLWAQPGVVRMDRDQLPALAVFHVQSRTLDPRRVASAASMLSRGSPTYRQFGEDEQSQRVRNLAQQWSQDVSPGWPQIQAVVAHLRTEFVHDRDARPGPDSNHTVADFLFESRRGPDYQFASAAVWLLRSLGYSARLASGFYADPKRYDARSRHTPVFAEDVHFWPEVHVGHSDWIPLEPTPGYELLGPPPTAIENVQAVLLGLWRFVVDQVVWLTLASAVIVWLILQRTWLTDVAATALWSWWPRRDIRRFVRRTLRLLDARCRRVARSRPPGITPTRWLQRIADCDSAQDYRVLSDFVQLADWACFAPETSVVPFDNNLDELCCNVVRTWSMSRLRRLGRAAAVLPQRRRLFSLFPKLALTGKIAP